MRLNLEIHKNNRSVNQFEFEFKKYRYCRNYTVYLKDIPSWINPIIDIEGGQVIIDTPFFDARHEILAGYSVRANIFAALLLLLHRLHSIGIANLACHRSLASTRTRLPARAHVVPFHTDFHHIDDAIPTLGKKIC